MSFSDSTDFKELVRSRTDLVSLIGESIGLQAVRGGHEFVGLCPFHDDSRPSMRVYPDRQSFRCWACSAGGDCFTYVMLRERVEFAEALELLATRAHLEMPKRGKPADGEEGLSKARIFEVLAWAEAEFHDCLLNSSVAAPAREYLASRGLTQETIRLFRIGFHPDNWGWTQERARQRFTPAQLLAARLIGERDGGGHYDCFVNRVIFPIRDLQGRCIAYGGRILPGASDSHGKYWNSPESPLFSKSRILYALETARDAITEQGTAIVVEGYTDCITAHQHGMRNVVATLGTALTEQHVTDLRRFARKVVMVYDGDAAGQNATERSLPRLLAHEVDLRILSLPGNADPADALTQHGRDWFSERIAQAPEVWEFKLRRVSARHGSDSVDASQRVLEEMLDVVCEVPTFFGGSPSGTWQVREDLLLVRLAQKLGLSEAVVRQRLAERRRQKRARTPRPAPAVDASPSRTAADVARLIEKPGKEEQLECDLLEIILLHPDTIVRVAEQIEQDDLSQPLLRHLLNLCLKLAADGHSPGFTGILAAVSDPDIQRLAAWLESRGRAKNMQAELLDQILDCFRKRREFGRTSSDPRGGTREAFAESRSETKDLLRQTSDLNRKRHAPR